MFMRVKDLYRNKGIDLIRNKGIDGVENRIRVYWWV